MKNNVQEPNTHGHTDPPRYTTIIGPNDVILGQGSSFIRTPGNLYFRQLLQERRGQYISTCRRKLKHEIAQQIIVKISDRNGRFLREVPTSSREDIDLHESSNNTKTWVIVDEKSVAVTIKQTLRDPNFRLSEAHDETVQDEFQLIPRVESLEETGATKHRSENRIPALLNSSDTRSDYHEPIFDRQLMISSPGNIWDQPLSRIVRTLSHPQLGFSSTDIHNVPLTQLLRSNTAPDVNRYNFAATRNQFGSLSSNDIFRLVGMTPSLPNISDDFATSTLELDLRIRQNLLLRERYYSDSFNNSQSLDSVENFADQGRQLLLPNFSTPNSLEYTNRNNFNINYPRDALNRCDDRNSLLHEENQTLPSTSLSDSRTFQPYHLGRLYTSISLERCMNGMAGIHNAQEYNELHKPVVESEAGTHNKTANERKKTSKKHPIKSKHNSDETLSCSSKRSSSKQIESTTNHQKRKYKSDDDDDSTSELS
jgi:hypothetical protein